MGSAFGGQSQRMYPFLLPLSVLREPGSKKVDMAPEGESMLEANHSFAQSVNGAVITELLGTEEPAHDWSMY